MPRRTAGVARRALQQFRARRDGQPGLAGLLAASDDDWKAWLRERQIPIFAWSSQARGFFTDRAGPRQADDPELVNAWYSDKNFARRDRAIELGKRLGKNPIHVALAYCWRRISRSSRSSGRLP